MAFFFTTTFLYIVLTAILAIFLKTFSTFDYWEKKGVHFIKPLPLVGNFWECVTFRYTLGTLLRKFYFQTNLPYFGIYIFRRPYLVLKDLNLIKSILVRDFNHFNDRNVVADKRYDPYAANMLFFMKNPDWKFLRANNSPFFSNAKLKNMSSLINAVAEDMDRHLAKNLNADFIEVKEICAKYTTDVISSCAFGIKTYSFDHEDSAFRQVGRRMFNFNFKNAFAQISYFVAPIFVKIFKLCFFDHVATSYLNMVFWETIRQRESTKDFRNDYIDMVIEIKKSSSSSNPIKFEGDVAVSQTMQIFAAGFDTASTAMGFALYELCIQPEIQDKLRKEVHKSISEHGELNYETVQGMKYLNMIACETLRKFPPLPFLDRVCVEEYQIPNSDVVLEKGTPVLVPLMGLHYDPELFPEPEKFDPERFSDENKASISSFSYLPFGEGPRNCIGLRFGLYLLKVGIAKVIAGYELEPCANTRIPIELETKSFLLGAKGGMNMKIRKFVANCK